MARDPIGPINPDDPTTKGQRIGDQNPTRQPDQKAFQSHMKPTSQNAPSSQPQEGVSPMELSQGARIQTGGPNLQSLLGQIGTTQESLTDIQKKLKTPNLKFKRQHQYLIKNKLNDANAHLRAAGQKLGMDLPAMKKATPGSGPLERFVGMITDGQDRLQQVRDRIKHMGNKGQLSPRDYLLIQIKLSAAQQEIEYTSVLLGKMVDTLKTTLNIQI